MVLTLKKLLAWWHNGLLVLGFYVLGLVFWRLGVGHKPGTIFFVIAGLLIVLGFGGSVGWLWTRDVFWRSNLSRSERKTSDLYEQPKNSIWIWIGILAVLCLTVEWRIMSASKGGRPSKDVRAAITIFIDDPNADQNVDPERTKARPVPALHGAGDKDMVFALASLPRKQVGVHYDDKSLILRVVLRNTGSIDIRNARITIDSDASILPTAGFVAITDKEVSGPVPELKRFVDAQQEKTFPVELLIPEFRQTPGLLVTVEGANMRPISGAVKLMLLKNQTARSAGSAPARAPGKTPVAAKP